MLSAEYVDPESQDSIPSNENMPGRSRAYTWFPRYDPENKIMSCRGL